MQTFKFRIVKNIYFERGVEKNSYYTIQRQFSFLGISWWRTIRQAAYLSYVEMTFAKAKDAHDYACDTIRKKTVEGIEKSKTMEFYCFPNKD